MTETEITETEATEAEISEAGELVEAEEIRDAAAVLRKNRELLSDLKATKDRTAALEELARTLGGDEAAVDPKAFLGKRAADAQAAEHRARVVKEAVLVKLLDERRTLPKGGAEEVIKAVLADPGVTLDGDKILGLDAALSIAPRRASPMAPPPWTGQSMQRPAAPKSFEELQAKGSAAVQAFAAQSPETYQALKADFEGKLAKGTSLR